MKEAAMSAIGAKGIFSHAEKSVISLINFNGLQLSLR
jgi:hypothetical protein